MTIKDAKELGPEDFVWDFFCRSPEDSMTARVKAASEAGFSAVGIYLGAWMQLTKNPEHIDQLEHALDECNMALANIETLRGWASPSSPSEKCLMQESMVWEIAKRFHCRYVQVIGNYTGSIEEAAIGFGSLCDRASEYGLLVGLEPVPEMTNIDSFSIGVEIIERADRENGGICFDSWHLTRSTNQISDIGRIPDGKIFATQWSDGSLTKTFDDYYTDTLSTRVPPGEGEFQLIDMMEAIQKNACQAPIGLEVPSTELWAAPIEEAAEVAMSGMRDLLAKSKTT
mgnify:FL=1|jgi:sugar phosphate isomerase/epimerase|tara:strand:+ start:186 stop:1040 length:855 start_codon:yes stop_codon:yes gene_type:complete